ncbi:spore germination protein [Ureibacillus massiliensis]|uniref:spore germination protein n=1 Tax=Ureibacillus massiliensis TaxID=292806 RepID=UPI000A03F5CE|nr:spore germination protein [Ureibacillus massiliensis]
MEENILKTKTIDSNLKNTIGIFNYLYSVSFNSDINIRTFFIQGLDKHAAVLSIRTISDTKKIEEEIIKPLLLNNESNKTIENICLAQLNNTYTIIEDVTKDINNGNAALFIDGETYAYLFSTSKFSGRSVEKAINEVSLKGPKEAFNEDVETNISLLRKKIRNENLIFESVTISKRSNNELYIVYLKDLVNDQLLKEVKKRINKLDVNAIQNLSVLEEYIEDKNKSFFPTILNTERPDRTASFLEDGYIVLLMNNSPESLILPATFWSFFHNPEDHYLRFIFGNFIRALRFLALIITLFVSSIYIAATNYHVEMIPADLLLAISATRESIPFPSIIEILLMEIAFELIREAGLRVPNPIGSTIGIVGALILGQAAVEANIVSPLVVIIVALSGLCSFAVGDVSLNFSIRLTRFLFIFAAAIFGFFGIVALLTCGLFYLVTYRSFGVPYLAPMTPKYISSKDTIFRKLLKKEIYRPGYLKTQDTQKKKNNG